MMKKKVMPLSCLMAAAMPAAAATMVRCSFRGQKVSIFFITISIVSSLSAAWLPYAFTLSWWLYFSTFLVTAALYRSSMVAYP